MPDLKFQQLTGATPVQGDIFPYVKDPSGVPLDRKSTLAELVNLQNAYTGGNNVLTTTNNPVAIRNSGIVYGNQPDVGSITDITGDKIQIRLGDNRTSQSLPLDAVAQTILDDTAVTFVAGETYTASTIAFFDNNPAADTITDSAAQFVIEGFVIGDTITITGSTSNNGTYTIATVTAGTITLDDAGALTNEAAGASVTITSANNKIDFGINLATLSPVPVAVPGITTHLIGLSFIFLKDSSVSSEENFYSISYLMDGGATNSVAIVAKADGTIPTFTSATGTAKILNPVDAIFGRANSVEGGPMNVRIFTPGMGDTTAIGSAEFIDATTFQFGRALFNAGSISTALDVAINLGPAFGETADVPFKMYASFGGPHPNAPDKVWLDRTIDPTNLAPFGPSGMWYNGRFKYYDGATTQSIATLADIGSGLFDATVNGGGGADFTTFAAAVAAGNVSILVTGNTTEAADTTLLAQTSVWIPAGFTLAFGEFNILGAQSFIVDGGGTISRASTVGDGLVSNGSASVTAKNFTYTNSSTISDTPFVNSGCGQSYQNILVFAPSFTNAGLAMNAPFNLVNGARIIGGGANCISALTMASGQMSNVEFEGTFSTSGAGIMSIGSAVTADNINTAITNTGSIILNSGNLSNLKAISTTEVNLTMSADGATAANVYLNAGSLTTSASIDNCNISDFTCGILSLGTGVNNNFSNGKVTGATTLNGNFAYLSNVQSTSTMNILSNTCSLVNWTGTTISVTGDNNNISSVNTTSGVSINTTAAFTTISNSHVDGIAVNGDNTMISNTKVGTGGSANTIVIDAVADSTIVTGCQVDNAISDAGTNSSLSNNVIF